MKIPEITKFFTNVSKKGDVDMMVIAHDEVDDVNFAMQGNAKNIAAALFATMHDNKNPEATETVYTMIKDITFNILAQRTKWADDLLSMIAEIPDDTEVSNCIKIPFNQIES